MSEIYPSSNNDLDRMLIIPRAMTDDERLIRVVVKTIANERKDI